MCDIEDAYQFALNVEERLNRKFENKQRWRDYGGRTRGRYYRGQKNNQKNEDDGKNKNQELDNSYDAWEKYSKGRGFRRGGFHGSCFQCGEEGHQYYAFSHNQ